MSVIDLAKERDRCRSHHPATRAVPPGRGAPRPRAMPWSLVVGLATLALILNGSGGCSMLEAMAATFQAVHG